MLGSKVALNFLFERTKDKVMYFLCFTFYLVIFKQNRKPYNIALITTCLLFLFNLFWSFLTSFELLSKCIQTEKELPKCTFLHLSCTLQEDNESMYFYVIIFIFNLFSFVMMLHNFVAPQCNNVQKIKKIYNWTICVSVHWICCRSCFNAPVSKLISTRLECWWYQGQEV